MDAVLLAAGKGTRLRPLTVRTPKPLVPVANTPIIDFQITLLENAGFDRVFIPVEYLGEKIVEHVQGQERNMEFVFTYDNLKWGTAGAIGQLADRLEDTFLVISGDLLVDVDLKELMEFHRGIKATATIALTRVQDPTHYGIALLEGNRITQFLEKPDPSRIFSDIINAGIYVLETEVLDRIYRDRECDFSMDLYPSLMVDRFIGGYLLEGYWNDIGRPSRYLQANGDALTGQFPLSKFLDELSWMERTTPVMGRTSRIGEVTVSGPVLLGENCVVEEGSVLRSFVVLGDGVSIGRDTVLDGVVVQSGTSIGSSSSLRKSIVGRDCEIGEGVELAEGTVIGDETRMGPECRIGSNMKIWTGSTLGPHTMIVPD